jgi:hypothetical protein
VGRVRALTVTAHEPHPPTHLLEALMFDALRTHLALRGTDDLVLEARRSALTAQRGELESQVDELEARANHERFLGADATLELRAALVTGDQELQRSAQLRLERLCTLDPSELDRLSDLKELAESQAFERAYLAGHLTEDLGLALELFKLS